jgi:molybdenum cofactor guanylyltransferase
MGESKLNSEYLIAILAGGKSRRMGEDKAALVWHGQTLLERIAREAQKVSACVCVIGRNPSHGWPLEKIPFLPDAVADAGPLGGLLAALQFAQHRSFKGVLATACDMPLLDSEDLRWLLQQSQFCKTHGSAVQNQTQIEPLFSLYKTETLPLVKSQLNQNRKSLHGLIERGDFQIIKAPDLVCAKLLNVNRPEDWKLLQGP